MGKPHKHAELIKAWADGAEIEYFDDAYNEWELVSQTPAWLSGTKYRIKPEPKPDVVMYVLADKVGFSGLTMDKTPVDNLRLTFDCETGKLKKAEVIE